MNRHTRVLATSMAALLGFVGVGLAASVAGADAPDDLTKVDGTIWVANRGAHTIRPFDAATGVAGEAVPMTTSSQPGDLAYARGKLYVAEEFPPPPIASGQPGIAIVDPDSGVVIKRIPIGPAQPVASHRPHHVHASPDGRLVAFGLYGTDNVAVVETRTDTLLEPSVPDASGQRGWDTNPDSEAGRAHAGVFSPNGKTLYVASDASSEVVALDPRTGDIRWRLNVPGAHEIAVMRNGRTAFVARRTLNRVAVVDLVDRTWGDVPDVTKPPGSALVLGLPDTLRLARNDRLLTIGLRSAAQVVVLDTRTFETDLVQIGPVAGIAGHQWTSPNGRYTFAAFEVGSNQSASGVAVIDHRDGNNVVQTLGYAGRPHGVDLQPDRDDDDDDDEEEDDD